VNDTDRPCACAPSSGATIEASTALVLKVAAGNDASPGGGRGRANVAAPSVLAADATPCPYSLGVTVMGMRTRAAALVSQASTPNAVCRVMMGWGVGMAEVLGQGVWVATHPRRLLTHEVGARQIVRRIHVAR